MQKAHQTHSFAEFTLDLTRGCLFRGKEEIRLRPKSFEVLRYLVENHSRLISKDELIQAVWVDTAVTDDSVVQCLKDIRRALSDETQRIIKTVPRRGYIFDREVRSNAVSPAVTTYTEETGVQFIIEEEETNGHGDAETRRLGDAGLRQRGDVILLPPAQSKNGHFIAAIKQHKWTAALGALTLAVAASAIVYFTRPGEAIDSVAVMPFVNVNGDPNTEYLSDGISDSVINNLSQLPDLKKVISFNSALRYKGKQSDPQVVGRELGVRAVLMGRLVQHGDELSISTELVDVRDNRRLWGGQYNRKLADITAVQTEIAREISEKLRLRLTGEEKQRLTKRYTESGEAYQLYTMGRFFSRKRTKEGWEKGIDHFERAIEKDPNYALAYVGLARVYSNLGFTGLLPPKEARQKEEWAALKALEIDDTLAEAHLAMSHLRELDLNWSAAEAEAKRAQDLNPNSVDVYATANSHLYAFGRFDEAMKNLNRAQELDPLSPNIYADMGLLLYFASQFEQAIERFQKALELDPNFAPAHTRLGWVYLTKGMHEEAIAEQKKAIEVEDPTGRWRRTAMLGHIYAVAGKRDEAQKILDDLKELAKQRSVSPLNFAMIHIGLGDKDQAFTYLEKTYQERPDALQFLKVSWLFDSLRSDPRFDDLLRRMKLV